MKLVLELLYCLVWAWLTGLVVPWMERGSEALEDDEDVHNESRKEKVLGFFWCLLWGVVGVLAIRLLGGSIKVPMAVFLIWIAVTRGSFVRFVAERRDW